LVRIRIRIRIRGPIPLTNWIRIRIRILLLLSVIFKMSTKNYFFAYYLLKVHLRVHHFQRQKVIKKSENSRSQCFFYYFCLMIEGPGSGSGSISLTNGSGCGSGRPKNIWILRIRIRNTASKDKKVQGRRVRGRCKRCAQTGGNVLVHTFLHILARLHSFLSVCVWEMFGKISGH
jgi:hypothetical protein